MRRFSKTSRRRFRMTAPAGIVLAISVLVLASCGGNARGGAEAEDGTVILTADPSAVPAFIAEAEGFFGDTKVDVTEVGNDAVNTALVAGKAQMAWSGPVEAADFASQGDEFQFLSTAGAGNMWGAVVVRAEDESTYQSLEDLSGKKFGFAGYGGGDWAALQVFAHMFYGIDDADAEFEMVAADSGALLALLEKGEIAAAMLHSGDAIGVRFSDKFKTMFAFTDLTQEELGIPIPITGTMATKEWAADHPEEVADVEAGLDEAVEWLKDNPQELAEGGKYYELAENVGWTASPETLDGVLQLIEDGQMYLTSEQYTEEWRNSIHSIIEEGEGTLVETVPDQEEYFYVSE